MMELDKVGGRYGAPMGRGSDHPGDAACAQGKGTLYEVEIDDGGYDNGGAYWGLGERLWMAVVADPELGDQRHFFRSEDPLESGEAAAYFPEATDWGLHPVPV